MVLVKIRLERRRLIHLDQQQLRLIHLEQQHIQVILIRLDQQLQLLLQVGVQLLRLQLVIQQRLRTQHHLIHLELHHLTRVNLLRLFIPQHLQLAELLRSIQVKLQVKVQPLLLLRLEIQLSQEVRLQHIQQVLHLTLVQLR